MLKSSLFEQYGHHPAFQMMIKAIRREIHAQLWVCGITFCLLIGLLIYSIVKGNSLLTVFSLGAVIIWLRVVFSVMKRRRVIDSPLIQTLMRQPGRIVWVYAVVTSRMPFGLQIAQNGLMYFKLINGDEFTLSAPIKELKLISRFLNRLLPHATFGFTKDREQWYMAAPELLLKET
jgi:hypothetical protein